jgi:hypothetical protein
MNWPAGAGAGSTKDQTAPAQARWALQRAMHRQVGMNGPVTYFKRSSAGLKGCVPGDTVRKMPPAPRQSSTRTATSAFWPAAPGRGRILPVPPQGNRRESTRVPPGTRMGASPLPRRSTSDPGSEVLRRGNGEATVRRRWSRRSGRPIGRAGYRMCGHPHHNMLGVGWVMGTPLVPQDRVCYGLNRRRSPRRMPDGSLRAGKRSHDLKTAEICSRCSTRGASTGANEGRGPCQNCSTVVCI